MRQAGGQVLDLEDMARHRGSVLGGVPDVPQPSQKGFESQLVHVLSSFDPALPVYAESESSKIGAIRVPDMLLQSMRNGTCLRLETPLPLRIELLRDDYAHFLRDPASLARELDRLQGLYSNELLAHWHALCEAQAWDEFIAELLGRHYDPAYNKSIRRNYPSYDQSPVLQLNGLSGQGFMRLAEEALAADA